MPVLDTSIVSTLLTTISPLAVELGVTLAIAETVFQWFIRLVFGRQPRSIS